MSVTGYMAFAETARTEWFLAEDYDVGKKKLNQLMAEVRATSGEGHDTANVIYGAPQIRVIGGHPFAFVQGVVFVANVGRDGLFKIDLDHRDDTTILDTGFVHTDGYVVDPQGAPMAESEYDAQGGRWKLRLWNAGWRIADKDVALIEHPQLEGLGRDGRSVTVSTEGATGSTIRELPAAGGAWSAPEPAPDDLVIDPITGVPIGQATLNGDILTYKFFDPKDQAGWDSVVATYPDSVVRLESMSADHRKFVVRVESLTDKPGYALVDLDLSKSEWLADAYDGLTPADVSQVLKLNFKAADGTPLSGYVTVPKGKPAKGLPLVVFPHGGPAARDTPGFDWWAQAMASRGYAVLQVNYRGSDGFGWDFMAKGFGQWGRKMQTDLSDGVRVLAKLGMIDPKRVCIVGASYGGYAALAGATLDPGVYRCAVSVAGPADLKRMVADDKSDEGDQGVGTERYWYRYMGPKDQVDAISPAKLADKAAIPILLIHGKDDTVVPYVQSQIMADALKKAGKPVEFITLDKEDHWLSRGETRLLMLKAAVAFLEKNNPPD
jgi:dipeptidyl aminopeptidase/acylaminoacyl peptidase